jgi:hypothetical protein
LSYEGVLIKRRLISLGGSWEVILERIETEDDLRIDIFTGFDELGRQTERDFEEQFKDMQTKISIYLNA